jgi:hypothetical protein
MVDQMTQPNYIAHVSMRGSDLLVKIDELEHINFISHSDSDMREQARHWISELEEIGEDAFTITYDFTDVPSQQSPHQRAPQNGLTLPEA